MTGETRAITAYLHIMMGPPSEYIRYDGKLLIGNSVEISSKTKLIMGRNPQVVNLQIFDLVDDSSISRIHCSIYFDAQTNRFLLTDENSSNGTYLNENRMNPYEPTALRHGDLIELGRVWKNGIQFVFAIDNINLGEAPKRVIVHSEQVAKSPEVSSPFPHLDALLQEKQMAEAAEKALLKNTLDLYDAVRQAFPEDYEDEKKDAVPVASQKTDVDTIPDRAEFAWAPTILPILAKYDVYISYSPENAEMMGTISKYLSEKHKLSVWVDRRIDIGGNWKTEAEKMIGESYSFLILMSPSAKTSEWVQVELNAASTQRLPIFSALLEGSEQNAIPIKLIGSPYTKLSGDGEERASALERLALEIRNKVTELKGKATSVD